MLVTGRHNLCLSRSRLPRLSVLQSCILWVSRKTKHCMRISKEHQTKSTAFTFKIDLWYFLSSNNALMNIMISIYRQDPQNISIVLTFGGHEYTPGFDKQLREAIFETTREYRYLSYIVHLIGDVLIVSGRIEHGDCPVYDIVKHK